MIRRIGTASGLALEVLRYHAAWQSAIAEDHRSLHGVIPLEDIRAAMQTLQSNCFKGAS